MLCLVFTRLAVDGVGHELGEVLLHLGLGGGTKLCILLDVPKEPPSLLVLYEAVDLSELQPMLQRELEVKVVTQSSSC